MQFFYIFFQFSARFRRIFFHILSWSSNYTGQCFVKKKTKEMWTNLKRLGVSVLLYRKKKFRIISKTIARYRKKNNQEQTNRKKITFYWFLHCLQRARFYSDLNGFPENKSFLHLLVWQYHVPVMRRCTVEQHIRSFSLIVTLQWSPRNSSQSKGQVVSFTVRWNQPQNL